MIELPIYDSTGKKVDSLKIDEQTLGGEIRHALLKQAYVITHGNQRQGSARTKSRGDIEGSTRKLYKQKGTGNARHGDKRAPIFVGGGVVFGPRPRDYSKHVPKNVRKLALRRVLGDLVRDGSIKTLSSFSVADGKTKSFISAVTSDAEPKKVLIVAKSFDDKTYLAARNVGWAQLVTAESLNVEELLHANTILVVEDALETLAKRTA